MRDAEGAPTEFGHESLSGESATAVCGANNKLLVVLLLK